MKELAVYNDLTKEQKDWDKKHNFAKLRKVQAKMYKSLPILENNLEEIQKFIEDNDIKRTINTKLGAVWDAFFALQREWIKHYPKIPFDFDYHA